MDSGRKLASISDRSNRDSSVNSDRDKDSKQKEEIQRHIENYSSNNEDSSYPYGINASPITKSKNIATNSSQGQQTLNIKVDVYTGKEDVATKRELLK